jgi:hypothetical protein
MSENKITVGKQEKARKIALKKLAEFIVDGSVVLGDIEDWSKSEKHWKYLSPISFLDLVNEVNSLIRGVSAEDASDEITKSETKPEPVQSQPKEKGRIVKMSNKTTTKKEKISDEKATEVANQVKALEGFRNPGDKMSKRDIASALDMSEDLANAGLQMLKTDGIVKSNRGRNAKWERLK